MAPPEIKIEPIHIEPTKIQKVDIKIPKIGAIKIGEMKLDIKAGDTAMTHYDGVGDTYVGFVIRNKVGESLTVDVDGQGHLQWRKATSTDIARYSLPLITNIKAGTVAAGGIVGLEKGTIAKNEKGEILVVDLITKDGLTYSGWRAATPEEVNLVGQSNVDALTNKWSTPASPQANVTPIRPDDQYVAPTDETANLRGPSPKVALGVWRQVVEPVMDLFGVKPPPLSERIKGKVEGNLEFWLGVDPKGTKGKTSKDLLKKGGLVETLSNKAENAVIEIYLTGRTQQDIPIELFDLVSTAKELGVPAEMAQEVLFAHMARREVGKRSFDLNTQRADDFKSAIEAARLSSGSMEAGEGKALFLLAMDPVVAEHFILEQNAQGEFFFSNAETRTFRQGQKLAEYIDQNIYPEPFHLAGDDQGLASLFLDFFKPLDKNGLTEIFRSFGMPEERLVGNPDKGIFGQQGEIDALWNIGYEGFPLSVDNLHFEDDAMRFDGIEPLSTHDVLDWNVGHDTRVDIQAGTDYYSTRHQAEFFLAVADRLREKMPEKTDAINYAENRAAELDRQARGLDPSGELRNNYLESQLDKQFPDQPLLEELNLRLGEDTVMELSLSDIQIVGH